MVMASMVIFAMRRVLLATVIELTIAAGAMLTVVVPPIKFDPMTVTSTVCPRDTCAGIMLSADGTGLSIVKGREREVPPPGGLLMTEKSCVPVPAVAVMLILAVKLVGLVTVIE